jgi:hypothetical protein
MTLLGRGACKIAPIVKIAFGSEEYVVSSPNTVLLILGLLHRRSNELGAQISALRGEVARRQAELVDIKRARETIGC